ncbi:GNAT family N-acetyltransferase [Sneathiella limimaris]|uniref:GNAT family N-acetyltransferase n=1 Tax=Sneathiella limimaris TaxID=1964213 RepID=UPI00146B2135|nr:GNAT family N-acetyltransferase [Sneathiella limimaris]
MTNLEIKELNADSLPDFVADLSGCLKACVEAGANVNFILPFSLQEAEAYWIENALPALQRNERDCWIALQDGKLAGTVQLIKKLTPNQIHRAEVTKLLVHPNYRRLGIADKLMRVLIERANSMGKNLVTLDTVTDSPAQRLYEGHGFQLAGIIPGFAKEPDTDKLVPTSYMYLNL